MRPRSAALAVCALAVHAADGAAQDCQVKYAYAPSPTSNSQSQVNATRGQTVAVNRSDMLYVTNAGQRKVEVQVTVPTGGSKWVPLDKSQRDPPALNYIGNVTLQKVKCPHLYESPVAMYTARMAAAGPYPNQFVVAQSVIQEFNLSATQLLDHLQPHITALTAARLLKEHFNHTSSQVASVLKQRSYQLVAARDALWGTSTETERNQVASLPPFPPETAVLFWLKTPYGAVQSAQGMFGATLYGSVPVAAEKVVQMMKGAQYSPAEGVRVIRQHSSQGGAGVTAVMYPGGNTTNMFSVREVAQGLAAEFGATPVQVAQWLVAAAAGPEVGLRTAPTGLTAFSQNRSQITAWLVQAGFPLVEVAKGMTYANFAPASPNTRLAPVTPQQVVTGFKLAGVNVAQALQAFEQIRSSNFSWEGSQITEQQIRAAIREAGYPAGPTAVAFKQTYGAGNSIAESHILAFWLTQAGYGAKDVVDGMRAAYPGDAGGTTADRLRHPTADGFLLSVNQPLAVQPDFAAAGLKASYTASSAQVAGWLDAPWKPLEQAHGIYRSLSKSGADVAAWMKASRTPKEVGFSLFTVVTTDAARVASYLLNAGFSPTDAAEAIRYMAQYSASANISQSPDKVAVAMLGGGFAFDAILEGVTAQFPQVTRRQLLDWLCSSTSTRQVSNTSGLRSDLTSCPAK